MPPILRQLKNERTRIARLQCGCAHFNNATRFVEEISFGEQKRIGRALVTQSVRAIEDLEKIMQGESRGILMICQMLQPRPGGESTSTSPMIRAPNIPTSTGLHIGFARPNMRKDGDS